MSFTQQRLRRNGYVSEAVTNIGAVAVVNARAINIGSITRGNTCTWLLNKPNIDRNKNMAWAFHRAHKIKTCRDNLPDQPYDTLQPLFDSDLPVIVIAAGETPGRAKEPKSEPNNAKGGAPDHGIDVRDESAMDFTEKPHPPIAARQELPSTPVKPANPR